MSDPHDLARLGALALDVERARQVAAGLLRARNACECERTETPPAGYDPLESGWQPDPPCWGQPVLLEGPVSAPEVVSGYASDAEWCPTCRARQSAHESYLLASKALGLARRRLTLAARRVAGKEQT